MCSSAAVASASAIGSDALHDPFLPERAGRQQATARSRPGRRSGGRRRASRALQQSLPRPPSARRLSSPDRERIGDVVVLVAAGCGYRAVGAGTHAPGGPTNVIRSASSTTSSWRAGSGASKGNGAAPQARRARAHGRRRAASRSKLHEPPWPATPAPATKLRGIERLQRVRNARRACSPASPRVVVAAGGVIDRVEKLADRDRGRAALVGALVVSGVGDDHAAGSRPSSASSSSCTVLRSADRAPRSRGRRAAGRRRRAAPCEETPRRRDRAGTRSRWGTDRIGSKRVQTVRWPVRKLARVGRPCSRSPRWARISPGVSTIACAAGAAVGLGDQVVEHALQLGSLPAVAFGGRANPRLSSAARASAHSETQSMT